MMTYYSIMSLSVYVSFYGIYTNVKYSIYGTHHSMGIICIISTWRTSVTIQNIFPERWQHWKITGGLPVASAAISYHPRSVDARRLKCIVSLYISWRTDQMTWILRNLRLRLVFRLRDAPKVRKSRSSVEFAYATSRTVQENKKKKKKIDESARSRAYVHSTHARHIHARACFLVHRFLVSSRANARKERDRNLFQL